jgi:Ras-related protein Rab-21
VGKAITYKLSVWDTAGQEQHHALNTIYYRGAQGALIVYDITDDDSFAKMSMWVNELRQQCGEGLPIVVVGNKCDKEQERQI